MARPRDPALELRLLGLRFVQRDTERDYRRWRRDTVTAFARIGYVGSIPSWTLLLVAVVVLDAGAAERAGSFIVGWIALLVLLTALTYPARLRRATMPLAALANCLAGFLIVWLLDEVFLSRQPSQARAGVMTAGLVVVMFFGFAIFRIAPLLAVAAVTPYVVFGSYQVLEGASASPTQAVGAWSLVAAQWIAYLGCLLVCVVIDGVHRRTFVKDAVIALQQIELQQSRETIRCYVPRAVVEHIVQGDAAGIEVPRRRRVTVLFADLVGFTVLADRVEGEVLTQVANDYLTAMTHLVDLHGGTVNEFAGDGLMAIFGAPDEMDLVEQATSAVRAAQAMQALLPDLNREWEQIGVTTPMQMRIGINTGVLSVGSFGSEGRRTYTAMGLHTNIAARLQGHCEPGDILLSDASWFLVRDVVECVPRGELECRGVHYPVAAYSPVVKAASASVVSLTG